MKKQLFVKPSNDASPKLINSVQSDDQYNSIIIKDSINDSVNNNLIVEQKVDKFNNILNNINNPTNNVSNSSNNINESDSNFNMTFNDSINNISMPLQKMHIQNNNNQDNVLKYLDCINKLYIKIIKQILFYKNTVKSYLISLHNYQDIDNIKSNMININTNFYIALQLLLSETYTDTLQYIFNKSTKTNFIPGYWLEINKNTRNIKIVFIDSYCIRFCSNGIGKLTFYDKNNKPTIMLFGEKFLKTTELNELEYRIQKSLKYIDILYNIFNTLYIESATNYNNLLIISEI